MEIKIYTAEFDPWREIQLHQDGKPELTGKYGASNIFIGTMRDFNDGNTVRGMYLEYYPGMTEKQLTLLVEQAQQQWEVMDVLLIHRVGLILPAQPIVMVAVWTSHRGDAFDASRYIIEALKSRAPFWKKEQLTIGNDRWVEKNTDGYRDSRSDA